jgi:four helix bundle protein
MDTETFHEKLKRKCDEYVHFVYSLTKQFPKEELYGATSQLRRSALSVPLNYIEGYARVRKLVHRNFLEISCGSMKESEYFLHFAFTEKYISEADYKKAEWLAEDIGGMLCGIIKKL